MILSAASRLFGRAKALFEPKPGRGKRHADASDPLRTTPSEAVVWAWGELKKRRHPVRHAVDAGCGKGRNSIFLAEQGADVVALDFMPGAVAHLKADAKAKGLSHKIRALVYDVTDGWPVPQHGIDLVADAFCFKHITGRDSRLAYKQNIVQALDVRGHYLISFASIGDGYYGRYIVKHFGDGSALTLDPSTNLQSVLFTREHVLEFFAPEFKPMEEKFSNEAEPADGQEIRRQSYAILFERNPKSQGGGYARVTPETRTIQPKYFGKFPAVDEKE